MNWKSTALVSGLGLLATWLAPPLVRHQPTTTAVPPIRQAAPSAEPAADIAREADRLRARLDAVRGYREPQRNPFRFGPPPSALRAAAAPVAPLEPAAEPAIAQVPALRIFLSGIAEDTVGGQVVRTAVISTPGDVLLVKEGDSIAGQYRVTGIASEAVELTRTADGLVVRLALTP